MIARHDIRRARERGVTLLEIVIVLAIIGLLMVVGYMAIRNVTKAALREDATSLTAMLRAAHNMAAMSGKTHRLVIDLDHQVMRIESCEGKIKLSKAAKAGPAEPPRPEDLPDPKKIFGPGSTLPPEIAQSVAGKDPLKVAAALQGKKVPDQCGPPTLPNGDSDGRGDERKIHTDEGVHIRRVFVQHLEDPALEGVVTINFFPMGYSEKAVIEIGHEDGGQFTILVHGLTSRVELKAGEVDPDELMRRDGAGDKVDERQ